MKAAEDYVDEINLLSKHEIVSERFGKEWKHYANKYQNREHLIEIAYEMGKRVVLYERMIETIQKDAYNQALIDAALLAKVENVMIRSGNHPEHKYQVDKESILRLKK